MQEKIGTQPPTRNIKISHDENGTLIRKWWIHYSYLPLFLLTIVWNGFTIFWYLKHVAGTSSANNPILLVPLTLCVALVYLALAKATNRTEIRVNKHKIKVSSGPLPWCRSCEFDIFNIKNLIISKDTWVERAQYVTYEVKCVDHSGKEHSIIKGLELSKQADFIRQILISCIGLKGKG